jgi:hypothetical protein
VSRVATALARASGPPPAAVVGLVALGLRSERFRALEERASTQAQGCVVGEPSGRLPQNVEAVIGVGRRPPAARMTALACGQPTSRGSTPYLVSVSVSAHLRSRARAACSVTVVVSSVTMVVRGSIP